MKKTGKNVTSVNGGWVVRDADTGKFREVRTSSGDKARLTKGSWSSVKDASEKRSAALRRLADR